MSKFGKKVFFETDGRETAAKRGYGSRWRRSRLIHLKSNPFCVCCEARGRNRFGAVVDHIEPAHKPNQELIPELFWDPENWQTLCRECHDHDKRKVENRCRKTGNSVKDSWKEFLAARRLERDSR